MLPPYFVWVLIIGLALAILITWASAYTIASRRSSEIQVALFKDKIDVFAIDCYNKAKSFSQEELKQRDIEVVTFGESEIVRFARIPGQRHLENYEIVYSDGKVTRVIAKFGDSLEVSSDMVDDYAMTIMKLHYLLRDKVT